MHMLQQNIYILPIKRVPTECIRHLIIEQVLVIIFLFYISLITFLATNIYIISK